MKHRNHNTKTPTYAQPEPIAARPKTPWPTPEQIRQRAREIFEARGQVPGHELNDWLQAEIELKSGTGL
jgi:hypothetical protein